MAAKEYLTEQIKYLNDLLRLFWVSLLVIGGGTASLLLGKLSILKVVFAVGGIVAIIVLAVIMRRLDVRIRELLEQLKEG
jgi:hypothetical protein